MDLRRPVHPRRLANSQWRDGKIECQAILKVAVDQHKPIIWVQPCERCVRLGGECYKREHSASGTTYTWSAHYAVVVWDPARVARDALLAQPAEAPAFVLDAWRHGEPEIYTVADWIDIPILVMTPPLLEDLTLQYGLPPR